MFTQLVNIYVHPRVNISSRSKNGCRPRIYWCSDFFVQKCPLFLLGAGLSGAACGATACGLAGCDKRSRRPQSAFRLCFWCCFEKRQRRYALSRPGRSKSLVGCFFRPGIWDGPTTSAARRQPDSYPRSEARWVTVPDGSVVLFAP